MYCFLLKYWNRFWQLHVFQNLQQSFLGLHVLENNIEVIIETYLGVALCDLSSKQPSRLVVVMGTSSIADWAYCVGLLINMLIGGSNTTHNWFTLRKVFLSWPRSKVREPPRNGVIYQQWYHPKHHVYGGSIHAKRQSINEVKQCDKEGCNHDYLCMNPNTWGW